MSAKEMSDMASTDHTASVSIEEQQTLDLVHELLQSFQNGAIGMAFACGGTIPIPDAYNMNQQSLMTSSGATTCQPVTLRWDPSSKSVPASECKLQFPLDESDSKTVHNMQQLLHDMQPATFGYQGQEDYKLDPSNFACTFSPHKLGIVDDIALVLLPWLKDEATRTNQPVYGPHNENIERAHEIRAELDRLNVYTGPSGHFKAQVATSRSTDRIGSLVVCLPSVHQGGQLQVRHEGRTMTFDWSMPESARPEIQWAAFYSDCEHEVLPVTSGHRITLTYNLYASPKKGTSSVGNGLIGAAQLPLYGILHKLFLQDNFMPDGGYIGVHTSHAYPHTSSSSGLPWTLKGSDMLAWETFRSLGCGVRLRPVVELPDWAHYAHEDSQSCPAQDCTDTSSEGYHSHTDDESLSNPPRESGDEELGPGEAGPCQMGVGHVPTSDDDTCSVQIEIPSPPSIDFGKHPTTLADILPEEINDDRSMAEGSQDQDPASGPGRWEVDDEEVQALQKENEELKSLPKSQFTGIEPACLLLPSEEDEEDKDATAARFEQHGVRSGCLALGNGLSFYSDPNVIGSEGEMKQLLDRWIKQKPQRQERTARQPSRVRYEKVAWLNHPGPGIRKEPQVSYTIYGYDPEAATLYSTCGIVARVPPSSTRRALLGREY